MKDLEMLKIIDETFDKKYTPTIKLETVGHSISGANCILNYKDGDFEIRVKCSNKAALRQFYDYMKTKGKLEYVDFEKFEEKYKEGIELDKIEEEIKSEQLPLENENKDKKVKEKK